MKPVSIRARWLPMAMLLALLFALVAPSVAAQSSTPETGETPEPGFETFGALPWEEPAGEEPYLVEEVTDGDTFSVIELDQADEPDPWWEPVRMIGIDSPEKDGPYTDEECYGQEASAFLNELLPEDTVVYLQVDNDEDIPDDQEFNDDGMELEDNDRWIVHAYLKAEGTNDYYLISEILALGGYVDVKDYDDNTYFVDELQDAEDLAREEDRGLWGACDM